MGREYARRDVRSRALHQALSWLGAGLAFVHVACDEAQPKPAFVAPLEWVPLIDQLQWRAYAAAHDPLPSHQPPQLECEPPGWVLELDRLELNTGECNYALLEHPAQLDVPRGSQISLTLWHFDLSAPEPAQAHVALFFDADLQWELTLDIPQPGNMQRAEFTATRALAIGDPIRLHLHNHGRNSWILSSIEVERRAD